MRGAVRGDAIGAAPQQCHRTAWVVPLNVRATDGDLRDALPEVALVFGGGVPGGLPGLVSLEEALRVEVFDAHPQERLGIVGQRFLDVGAGVVAGERTPKLVTRSRIARAATLVSIPIGHRRGCYAPRPGPLSTPRRARHGP